MGSRSLITTIAVAAALTLPCLVACSGVSESSTTANANSAMVENRNSHEVSDKKVSEQKIDGRLVSANTEFGFKLFREIAASAAGRNVFISPSSVALALAMTYNGASGETRQAMARALEVQAMSLEEVNRVGGQLRAALEGADPKARLLVANSLWARRGVGFKQDFIERNRQFYGAEVAELNFDDPSAPATINAWVSDKTSGKIARIVDQIGSDTILFLINAIYFKGQWSAQFDKARTKEEPFTLSDGRQKKVQMMTQSGEYDYFEGPNFQAVSLPYGERRLSMYIFLPAKGAGLAQLQKNLTAANWNEWMTKFGETPGDIGLPRFKVEFETELSDALKAMGMGVAFDEERADFSDMVQNGEKVAIHRVKHKTFAEVNEEGTEAAAVTSVEMRTTSIMRPRRKFRLIVDRPFLCAIRDKQTGAILFIGSILDPQ
jgi:serine protease inhibitor